MMIIMGVVMAEHDGGDDGDDHAAADDACQDGGMEIQ